MKRLELIESRWFFDGQISISYYTISSLLHGAERMSLMSSAVVRQAFENEPRRTAATFCQLNGLSLWTLRRYSFSQMMAVIEFQWATNYASLFLRNSLLLIFIRCWNNGTANAMIPETRECRRWTNFWARGVGQCEAGSIDSFAVAIEPERENATLQLPSLKMESKQADYAKPIRIRRCEWECSSSNQKIIKRSRSKQHRKCFHRL